MTPGPAVVLLSCLTWIPYTPVALTLPQTAIPSTPSRPNITFYIYPTPEAVNSPVIDDINSLIQSHPLTVVFHGFKGDHTARSMESIKQALLLIGESNVVIVDWGPLADSPKQTALGAYHHVRDQGVPAAAALAVQWLQQAVGQRDIPPGQVHLVGFSLGAHVVGVVGHLFNSSLGRITGLDPPHFGYEKTAHELRLDDTDAMFVNVIHTSAGILSYSNPIGHVDFFPNGDVMPQRGCPHNNPIDIITCSHYFAFAVFAESIYNNDAFIATECPSWKQFTHGECEKNNKVPMGYATPPSARGVFYQKTKEEPPFGNDDANHPLPPRLIRLLKYDENDTIVKPVDIVHFLMHKEPTQRASGDEPETAVDLDDREGAWVADEDNKVMRVKTGRLATTTPNPPAFLDNSSPEVHNSRVTLTALTGSLILRIFGSLVY